MQEGSTGKPTPDQIKAVIYCYSAEQICIYPVIANVGLHVTVVYIFLNTTLLSLFQRETHCICVFSIGI
jgi:hypothetical protein